MAKTQQLLVLEPSTELKFKGLAFDWCQNDRALHYIISFSFRVQICGVSLKADRTTAQSGRPRSPTARMSAYTNCHQTLQDNGRMPLLLIEQYRIQTYSPWLKDIECLQNVLSYWHPRL